MRKFNFILAATVTLIISGSRMCVAEGPSEVDKAMRQLGRGVGNVATGIFEVPDSVYTVQEEEGEVAAITYGLLRGVWRFGVREAVGVIEITTTPFVRFKPIIKPEWTAERGPLSAIYPEMSRYPIGPQVEWEVQAPELNKEREIPEPLPSEEGYSENPE